MADKITEVSRDGAISEVEREWIAEVPVAIEFNGLAYAVMMATPADLEDFVRGFALNEGLAENLAAIGDIAIAETDKGFIARAQLSGLGIEQLGERVRVRVAESSCGLCGIENLETLAKPLPKVPDHPTLEAGAIFRAIAELRDGQALNHRTGTAHGAGFAGRGGNLLVLREDVGRHNAIDKLVGALALAGVDPAAGFFLSTARCSYEIVEKVVRAGGASLVTISLPTSMAVERARAAGLSLYCLARDDSFLDLGVS
jgi:FdhD protein